MLLFINDGYWSDALVLCVLSMTTLRLSTITSFARLRRGAVIAAHLRLAPVPIVVARWFTNLDVIYVTSVVLCIAMTVDE